MRRRAALINQVTATVQSSIDFSAIRGNGATKQRKKQIWLEIRFLLLSREHGFEAVSIWTGIMTPLCLRWAGDCSNFDYESRKKWKPEYASHV